MNERTATRNQETKQCPGCGLWYERGRFLIDRNGNKMCMACYKNIYGTPQPYQPIYPTYIPVPPVPYSPPRGPYVDDYKIIC